MLLIKLLTETELHEKMDIILNAINSFSKNRTVPQASTIEASGYRIVPSLLSNRFTGRADELSWLENKLTVIDGEAIRCCVGIHGMTGVGKTQLVSFPWSLPIASRAGALSVPCPTC